MSQMDELRQIISGENTDQLKQLKQRIENVEARTADVAEVLAPAIHAGMKGDNSLISALKEPVSESLKQAIRTEPDVYAEILYPAISPSIRRAISLAISSLMITINQLVSSATSPSGIRTRIESFRTGIPFAELALLKTLVYRVDHIYLIERDSGLLIEECHTDGVGQLDSDAVSAMFSAIASFVQDSFSASEEAREEARLTDFKVGAHTVWAAHGAKLMLACVISGDPPQSLKDDLYDALDQIRTTYSDEIANFEGDSSAFGGAQEYLLPIMQMQLKDEDEKSSNNAAKSGNENLGVKVLAIALIGGLLWLSAKSFDARSKLSAVEQHLQNVPGIVVTKAYWQNSKIVIEGLRDEFAVVPHRLLQAYGLKDDQVLIKTSPFMSLDIDIESRRLAHLLALPMSVTLERSELGIEINGNANLRWLLEHQDRVEEFVRSERIKNIDVDLSADSRALLRSSLNTATADEAEAISMALDSDNWFELDFVQRSLLSRIVSR